MMKHINDLGSHKNKMNNDLVLFMQYQAVDHDSKNHISPIREKKKGDHDNKSQFPVLNGCILLLNHIEDSKIVYPFK